MALLSHDVGTLPWEVMGLDFSYGGRQFAVIVDFYSFFFFFSYIQELQRTTANSVKTVHGPPLKLVSDNCPPFTSREFWDFLEELDITHNSSPYHPRSNGMAERAVQEAKKLLKICSLKAPNLNLALMKWRNTPRDDILKSPSQRLMGRQTQNLLPVPTSHLERLQEIRQRQKTILQPRRQGPADVTKTAGHDLRTR